MSDNNLNGHLPHDSLTTPQSVMGFATLGIVALVLGLVAWRGSEELLTGVSSFILGQLASPMIGWFYGSAKGSQAKDATIASLAQQKAPTP